VNSGLPGLTGNELQVGVHVVKTWYKDDIERFTDEVLTGGFHNWNASLPFKDVCRESCIKVEITQGGVMGGSCIIWGGSIDMFRKAFRRGEWETILVNVDNCDFVAEASTAADFPNSNDNTTTVIPAFVTIKWDEGIACPAGQYLDDNWFLMEKFIEKDSCKVCKTNEYSETKGEFCTECPAGKVIESDVPAGHDSASDCQACKKGKYYDREIDPSLSIDGAAIMSLYKCFVCGDDEYSDSKGATECKECPVGKAIRNKNSAADHMSVNSCTNLCDSNRYFVSAGAYLLGFGRFGYESLAWCDSCSKCKDKYSDCSSCSGGRRLEEEGYTEEELEERFSLLAKDMEEEVMAGGGAEIYFPKDDVLHQQTSLVPPLASKTRPFKLPKDQTVLMKRPESMRDRHKESIEVIAEESDEDGRGLTTTEPCDTYYWGLGLKVSSDEERSDELIMLALVTNTVRARTSVQDAPLP